MSCDGVLHHVADLDPIVLRPVRPTDVEGLADLFDRLGPVTRYLRFVTPQPDTAGHARRVAHADGYATGATVALAGDRVIGAAEWSRAPRSELATVEAVVDDLWHRRRVATLLVHRLAAEASAVGVRTALTTVLASNHAAVALARSLDPQAVVSRLGTETTILAAVDTLAGGGARVPELAVSGR